MSLSKFRVWDELLKVWVNPSLIGIKATGEPFAPDETWLKHDLSNLKRSWFTGLKDKNGKDIYEGDIVRFDPGTHQLHWYPTGKTTFQVELDITQRLWLKGEGMGYEGESLLWADDSEVIGNIYEHEFLTREARFVKSP